MSKKFNPTYLYIKTHNKTGLKYFGKTTQSDPYKYKGSGKYWKNHIKKHGDDITTEVIGLFHDKNWCMFYALEFSEQNCVTTSKDWANIILENGIDGGDTLTENPNIIKIMENIRNSRIGVRWWNDGIRQIFTKYPPNNLWVIGRLPFNNTAVSINAENSKNKIWITNGEDDKFINKDIDIPSGYYRGRSSGFKTGRKDPKGTFWWNNGIVSTMCIVPPNDSYVRGRLIK